METSWTRRREPRQAANAAPTCLPNRENLRKALPPWLLLPGHPSRPGQMEAPVDIFPLSRPHDPLTRPALALDDLPLAVENSVHHYFHSL